jgi:hypothetical protein
MLPRLSWEKMMDCTCGGKIIILYKEPEEKPRNKIIYCSKCQRKYTWKEYQAMRCDKLVEMMKEVEKP